MQPFVTHYHNGTRGVLAVAAQRGALNQAKTRWLQLAIMVVGLPLCAVKLTLIFGNVLKVLVHTSRRLFVQSTKSLLLVATPIGCCYPPHAHFQTHLCIHSQTINSPNGAPAPTWQS